MGAGGIVHRLAMADRARTVITSLGEGWAIAAVCAVVVTVLASVGGLTFALTSSTHSPGAAQPATTPDKPDLKHLLPGDIRIEGTRRAHLVKDEPSQLIVDYHSRSSRKLLAMVLAWDRSAHKWQPVYNGAASATTATDTASSDVLVPSGSTTEAQFALGLIAAITADSGGRYDVPATPANEALIEIWMVHEGGLWANNPLNTSLDAAAYPHQITSSGEDTGIPIYPDLSVGIAKTAATLLGNPAYQGILAALASGSGSCIAFGSAVVESPWAASHYGYDPGSFCPSGTQPQLTASTASTPAPTPAATAPAAAHSHRARLAGAKHHKSHRTAKVVADLPRGPGHSGAKHRQGPGTGSSSSSDSSNKRHWHGKGAAPRAGATPGGSTGSHLRVTHGLHKTTRLSPVKTGLLPATTRPGGRTGHGHHRTVTG
jgi:hypothetical protein